MAKLLILGNAVLCVAALQWYSSTYKLVLNAGYRGKTATEHRKKSLLGRLKDLVSFKYEIMLLEVQLGSLFFTFSLYCIDYPNYIIYL